MLLDISILNTFILHTQKIIHKPVGSVWKQVKWKTILERNSIQSSSLHKHENTITMVQSDPYGGTKRLSFMIYFTMTLQNYYIHDRTPKSLSNYPYKGLLSNISTKMQNFQPKSSSKAQQTVLFYKFYFRQILTTLNSSGEDMLH